MSDKLPSDRQHHHRRASLAKLGCAVITVSDTRSLSDDTGGTLLTLLLEGRGHHVAVREIVKAREITSVPGSRLLVASSSTNTRGPAKSARAMATRCF